MNYVLKVKDLIVKYGNFKAVDEVSLSVRYGEVVTVVGPNGAGKTSLLKAVVGIEPIASGSIEVCGKLFHAGERVQAPKYLSYVPAVPDVDPWSRVEDLLEVSMYRSRVIDRGYVRYVVKLLGIERFMSRYFGSLSSGEGRLVMIATALVRKPDLVVMDEPLTFLDIKNQSKVMGIIKHLAKEGMSFLIASHEIHLVPLFSDYVLVMKSGKVVTEGTPKEALRKDILELTYGTKLILNEVLSPEPIEPTV